MNSFSKYLFITLGVDLLALVVLNAGTIDWIPGMIPGIATYTVIQVFSKEFLSKVGVVKKINKEYIGGFIPF